MPKIRGITNSEGGPISIKNLLLGLIWVVKVGIVSVAKSYAICKSGYLKPLGGSKVLLHRFDHQYWFKYSIVHLYACVWTHKMCTQTQVPYGMKIWQQLNLMVCLYYWTEKVDGFYGYPSNLVSLQYNSKS